MISDSNLNKDSRKDVHFAVVVITYNSEKTVLATLESIRNQTVLPEQVVISDDGSRDDTLGICHQWIKKNQDKFKRIDLVSTATNTGVAANCNRGCDAVLPDCEWIKLIAGDDMLVPRCLEYYQDYIRSHAEAEVIYATIIPFRKEEELEGKEINNFQHATTHQKLSHCDVNTQCKFFDYFGQFTLSPTLMMKRTLHQRIPFDERVPMIEDGPFNYNCLHQGVKLYYCPMVTVYYRIGDSISHTSSHFFNPVFISSVECYRKYYRSKTENNIFSLLVVVKKWISEIRKRFFYNRLKNKRQKLGTFLFNYSGLVIELYNKVLMIVFLEYKNHDEK